MTKFPNRFAAAAISALFRPYLRYLARPSLPRYRGDITLRGLENEVSVAWQSDGIPHVRAADEHDLFFAQGYLHAQERLWQMDLNRRFLSGRLAEVLGHFAVPWQELTSQFRGCNSVDADYFMRLIGIRRSAIASAQLLTDDERQRLEAYSSGVNEYIEQRAKRLPLEFRLLRYIPDPWRPEDTLIIGKGFAFLLSLAFFTRLNAIAVAAKLADAPERLHDLYPTDYDCDFTITRAVWDAMQNLWRFSAGMLAAGNWFPAGHGSNAWVVGPGRSNAGSAILCNDPHLRMTLPSVWYLMHLRAAPTPSQSDGYEVWGASVPGCPGIQVGHNRWVAWGVTAALCDDVEIYREKIHPLEPDRYAMDGHWHAMDRRSETIAVRRHGLVEKTMRWTRHGPVISDFNRKPAAGEVLSLRWTAHEASREFRAMYRVNRARNWQEFLQAISFQSAPALNFVYADNRGNIGYSLAGNIPLRSNPPGFLPRPGWRTENDWRGFIPFDQLPRLFNPPEGAIANANNRIVDSVFDHYLSGFFEPAYRARRIHALLAAKGSLSVIDMSTAQGDLVSLHAKDLIALLSADLAALHDAGGALTGAAERLLRWDGHCAADSVAAAIFHVFHNHLIKSLLVPALDEECFITYVEIFNQSITPITKILANPASAWFTERPRAQLVRSALAAACDELSKTYGAEPERWQWGKLHTLSLNHAFSRVGVLGRLLSVGPLPCGGDNFTVNMGFYRHSNPYQQVVGSSLRMIVEAGQQLRSRFIVPSGQSGHPFSPHYHDQTTRWQSQNYIELADGEEQIGDLPQLQLKPAG